MSGNGNDEHVNRVEHLVLHMVVERQLLHDAEEVESSDHKQISSGSGYDNDKDKSCIQCWRRL